MELVLSSLVFASLSSMVVATQSPAALSFVSVPPHRTTVQTAPCLPALETSPERHSCGRLAPTASRKRRTRTAIDSVAFSYEDFESMQFTGWQGLQWPKFNKKAAAATAKQLQAKMYWTSRLVDNDQGWLVQEVVWEKFAIDPQITLMEDRSKRGFLLIVEGQEGHYGSPHVLFAFTLPEHRRKGVASRLLEQAAKRYHPLTATLPAQAKGNDVLESFLSRRGFVRLPASPSTLSYDGVVPRVLNYQVNMPYYAFIDHQEKKAYVVNRFFQQLGRPQDSSAELVKPPCDAELPLWSTRPPWTDDECRAEYFETLRALEEGYEVVYRWSA